MSSQQTQTQVVNPLRSWIYCAVNDAVEAYDAEPKPQPIPTGYHGISGRDEPPPGPSMVRLKHGPEAALNHMAKLPQRVLQVAVGAEHGVLLTDAGVAYTWGDNRYGQLGRKPVHMLEDTRPFPVLDLMHVEVTQVASGVHHCLALVNKAQKGVQGLEICGQVWSWGRNKDGQLGVGDTRDKVAPVLVGRSEEECLGNLPESRIISIGASGMSSVAASIKGEVWQWGAISEEFPETDAKVESTTPTANKTLPHKVSFKLKDRKKGKNPVSISSTGCKVMVQGLGQALPPKDDKSRAHDKIKELIMNVNQLQEGVIKERMHLAETQKKRQGEEGGAKAGAKSALPRVEELRILEESLAQSKVEHDDMKIQIGRVQKNLDATNNHLVHCRSQLDAVEAEGKELEFKKDDIEIKLMETTKDQDPTMDKARKGLEDSLADLKKYVEHNKTTRTTLKSQYDQLEEERRRMNDELQERHTLLGVIATKMETLKKLRSVVKSATSTMDDAIVGLQEKSKEIRQHFEKKSENKDLIEAMKDFERNEQFLEGIAELVEVLQRHPEAGRMKRPRLVAALLQDIVTLRREVEDLHKDEHLKHDMDLSFCLKESCQDPKPGAEEGAWYAMFTQPKLAK